MSKRCHQLNSDLWTNAHDNCFPLSITLSLFIEELLFIIISSSDGKKSWSSLIKGLLIYIDFVHRFGNKIFEKDCSKIVNINRK